MDHDGLLSHCSCGGYTTAYFTIFTSKQTTFFQKNHSFLAKCWASLIAIVDANFFWFPTNSTAWPKSQVPVFPSNLDLKSQWLWCRDASWFSDSDSRCGRCAKKNLLDWHETKINHSMKPWVSAAIACPHGIRRSGISRAEVTSRGIAWSLSHGHCPRTPGIVPLRTPHFCAVKSNERNNSFPRIFTRKKKCLFCIGSWIWASFRGPGESNL